MTQTRSATRRRLVEAAEGPVSQKWLPMQIQSIILDMVLEELRVPGQPLNGLYVNSRGARIVVELQLVCRAWRDHSRHHPHALMSLRLHRLLHLSYLHDWVHFIVDSRSKASKARQIPGSVTLTFPPPSTHLPTAFPPPSTHLPTALSAAAPGPRPAPQPAVPTTPPQDPTPGSGHFLAPGADIGGGHNVAVEDQPAAQQAIPAADTAGQQPQPAAQAAGQASQPAARAGQQHQTAAPAVAPQLQATVAAQQLQVIVVSRKPKAAAELGLPASCCILSCSLEGLPAPASTLQVLAAELQLLDQMFSTSLILTVDCTVRPAASTSSSSSTPGPLAGLAAHPGAAPHQPQLPPPQPQPPPHQPAQAPHHPHGPQQQPQPPPGIAAAPAQAVTAAATAAPASAAASAPASQRPATWRQILGLQPRPHHLPHPPATAHHVHHHPALTSPTPPAPHHRHPTLTMLPGLP